MDKEKKRILEEEENQRKEQENQENQQKLNKAIVLWIITALLFIGAVVSIVLQILYLAIPLFVLFVALMIISVLKLEKLWLYVMDKLQRRQIKKLQETEKGKKWKKLKESWLEDNLPKQMDYLYAYSYFGEHKEFFDNYIADKNEEELARVFTELKKLLSEELYENLNSAYERYRELVRFGEEIDENALHEYDEYFLMNEDMVDERLLEFASTLD